LIISLTVKNHLDFGHEKLPTLESSRWPRVNEVVIV